MASEPGGRLLAEGEEPPGRYETNAEGRNTWQGDFAWRTRQGEAIVHRLFGRPMKVEGAMTPDGRLDIETLSPHEYETWRRPSPSRPGAWVHGTVTFDGSGVTFTDLPHLMKRGLPPLAEGDPPSLAHDMEADGAFLARLQDVGFAHAVYESLCNIEYRKAPSRRRWSCSWRRAGRFVAEMRDLGEGYLDFYLAEFRLPNGMPATEAEQAALLREVGTHYARMGWRAIDGEVIAEDHRRAMGLLVAFEGRPEGPCPDWAGQYPERDVSCVQDRAIMAARSGRMTKAEFLDVMDNLSWHETPAMMDAGPIAVVMPVPAEDGKAGTGANARLQ